MGRLLFSIRNFTSMKEKNGVFKDSLDNLRMIDARAVDANGLVTLEM